MSESLQERVEHHATGRAVLTGLILVILGALVSTNLPPSELQRVTARAFGPVRDLLGLDQAWGVFAPDPRSQDYDLRAYLDYPDGTRQVWRSPPKSDAVLGEYRVYHWQKWTESVRSDDHTALWRPLALWLVRTHTHRGAHPVTVTLVRRWRDLPPPGSTTPRGPWHQYVFYRLDTTTAEAGR